MVDIFEQVFFNKKCLFFYSETYISISFSYFYLSLRLWTEIERNECNAKKNTDDIDMFI